MKTKQLLFAATALLAFVSCSEDSFVGDQSQQGNGNGAISFVSGTPAITRASGSAAALALDYKFKVYGVKTDGTNYSNVFATGAYSTAADYNADPDAFWVWYTASTAGTTTSNTADWDYVGTAGTHGTTNHEATIGTGKDQNIKYWDYGANQYEFVAYSATAGMPTITKYQKDGFTVAATPAEMAGLYIADKLTINTINNSPSQPASGSSTVNKIGDVVRFTFRSAATQVRLGIYETIPGYVVKNVNFRPNTTGVGAEFAATTSNAKLSGSFNGTTSSSETFNITYNSTTGIAQFANTAVSPNNHFDFGVFTSSSAIGTSSTAPTWAGPTTSPYYQAVFPNTDHVANMILYVDYELYNEKSGETIKVKGAKAVVPEMYMTWNPNYAYTYLFKISDNTNGTTGTEGTSPEGLFPITFDAVTIAASDGSEVGTITTVSTPAITTYQNGSVSASGITYAHAKGDIYITVNIGGTLAGLTAENTKLYTVDAGTTEADLILATKTKTAVTSDSEDALSILAANQTVQDVTFTSGNAAKFTPTASTTYAIEYKVSNAVAATYAAVSNGTTLTKDKKYYTSDAGAGEFISDGTEVATGTNYYEKTAGSPAVYQYKIIEVGADS